MAGSLVAIDPNLPSVSSMCSWTTSHTPCVQKSYSPGPSIAATGTRLVASDGWSWPVIDTPCSGLSIVPT
jgi:hypothetical protein